MPFAPAVTNRSGEIMAQGISQAFGTIANSIMQYSADQTMTKQALGKFQGAIAADKNMLGVFESGKAPRDAQAAYDKFKTKGKIDVGDAAMLSVFSDSYMDQQKQAQAAEAQKMQLEAARQAQLQKARSDQLINAYNQPGAEFVMNPTLRNNKFLQVAAQAQQAGVPLNTAMDYQGRMDVQDLRNENAALRAGGKGDKTTPMETTLPSGAKIVHSPSTGAFSVLPQSPQQIAAAESAKTTADLNAKEANAYVKDVKDTAEVARNSVEAIDRIGSLYKQGATSGFGQPVLTQARSALARFGLGEKEIATQQQLEQELNELAMTARRSFMKGTGSVSNYETQMVQQAIATPTRTPEANLRILSVMKNIADRTIKLDQMRIQLENDGLPESEIAKRLDRTRSSMPVGIDSISDITPGPAEGGMTAKPGAAAMPVLQIKSIKRIGK